PEPLRCFPKQHPGPLLLGTANAWVESQCQPGLVRSLEGDPQFIRHWFPLTPQARLILSPQLILLPVATARVPLGTDHRQLPPEKPRSRSLYTCGRNVEDLTNTHTGVSVELGVHLGVELIWTPRPR